jgi:hypothetical protein
MFLLSQTRGPELLVTLISRLAKLEKTIASWTNPDVLKEMVENVPKESSVHTIYFKRYLELIAPEALERARSCASHEELQTLINTTNPESIEGEAYCFVQQYEMVAQIADANAKKCTTVKEVQQLLTYVDKDSVAQIVYELRLLDLYIHSAP